MTLSHIDRTDLNASSIERLEEAIKACKRDRAVQKWRGTPDQPISYTAIFARAAGVRAWESGERKAA